MPRTADGQPDLTGNWTNATYTPLERPANLGTKEFYTRKKPTSVAKARIAQFNSQAADDIHYDNAIWQTENYDKGLSSLRTSLVIDPPDGRIPALTAEAAAAVVGGVCRRFQPNGAPTATTPARWPSAASRGGTTARR